MTITDGIGKSCPRCNGDYCFIRHGSLPDYYQYVACPSCGFAYAEHHNRDATSKTNGKYSGAYIWQDIFESHPEAATLSELEAEASTTPKKKVDKISEVLQFGFDEFDEWMLDACATTDQTIRSIVTARDATSEMYPTVADVEYDSVYRPENLESMFLQDNHKRSESGYYVLWIEGNGETEDSKIHIQRTDRYYIPTSDRKYIEKVTEQLEGRRITYGQRGHAHISRDFRMEENCDRIEPNEIFDELLREL